MPKYENKGDPLVVPKIKPRNPLGLKRKGTVKHKDKRRESENILDSFQE